MADVGSTLPCQANTRIVCIEMTNSRPPIPDPIKRAVRRRCGFGCVFCGAPIYDYDHIEPFSSEQSHAANNLTLLCPNHHREKTAGRLAIECVREANLSPRNNASPYTAYHQLYFQGSSFRLRLGGTWFTVCFDAIADKFIAVLIDERPLFSFRRESAKLLIDLALYHEDGNLLLEIDRSELRCSIDL
jgi:hypothetical protein